MSDEPKQNFLDLSKIKTSHQLESALSKVSDLRLRTEKLREEDIVSSLLTSREKRSRPSEGRYPFLDPVPASMIDIDIQELSMVDIDWKMLTLARPGNKFDEDIFTRYVEMAKLSNKAREANRPVAAARTSIVNTRLGFRNRFVEDSGDENNQDNVNEFSYEHFARQPLAEEEEVNEEPEPLDRETQSGAKRRPFVRRQIKKPEEKSNRLTVPQSSKPRSRSSTPEFKGRKSRSVTPSAKTPVATVGKSKDGSKKKKSRKKKPASDET